MHTRSPSLPPSFLRHHVIITLKESVYSGKRCSITDDTKIDRRGLENAMHSCHLKSHLRSLSRELTSRSLLRSVWYAYLWTDIARRIWQNIRNNNNYVGFFIGSPIFRGTFIIFFSFHSSDIFIIIIIIVCYL